MTIENSEKFIAEEFDHAKVIAGKSKITWKLFFTHHITEKKIKRKNFVTQLIKNGNHSDHKD